MGSLSFPMYSSPFPGGNLSTIPLTNQTGQFGQNVSNAGQEILTQGNSALLTSGDYWRKLLSGDYTAMQDAVAPTANMLSQAYTGAQNNLNQGSPLGGYRAASMAMLPQSQASQLGTFLQSIQPTAAQNLAQIGQTQGQLGLGETQQGSSILSTVLQSLLAQRGQNIQNASGLLSGIGSMLGGVSSFFSPIKI